MTETDTSPTNQTVGTDEGAQTETVEIPKAEYESLKKAKAERDELRERLDDTEHETERNSHAVEHAYGEIDELDAKLGNGLEYVHERIDRLAEVGSGDENPTLEAGKSGSTALNDGKSPLEQLTNIPEHLADEQLTKNQERARFVARDIEDYADNTPKGLVIDSAAISRVLTVRDGEEPHRETVSRVMEFLEEFGKGEVTTKMHKGRRIAVFEKDAARRYGAGRIEPSQCVVTRGRGRP